MWLQGLCRAHCLGPCGNPSLLSTPRGWGSPSLRAGVQAWHREILSPWLLLCLRPTLGCTHPVFLCLENKESHYSSPSTFQKQCRWSPLCMYPMSKCQMVRDAGRMPTTAGWLGFSLVGQFFVEWVDLGLCLLPSFPFSNCFQLRKLPYLCSQFL